MATSKFFLGVGFAAAAFFLCAAPASAQKVLELNIGHGISTSSHYHAAATKMAELVAQKSGGTMKLNIFPNSQLGGEVKMLQSLRTGTQDLIVIGEAPLESFAKEFTVYSFPYLFTSLQQANAIVQGPVGQEMLGLLPKHNLIGLNFISSTERNVFTNGKTVEKVEDMKGLKVRVIQGPGYVKAYQAMGAQPTPMAWSELYTSLQNGTVDAGENSPDTFVADRFIEVSKTFTVMRVIYMPALIIMSKARHDALTPDQQKVIRDASAEAATFATAHYKKDYDDSMAAIRKSGVKVFEPDLKPFIEVGRKTHAELLRDFPMAKPWYDKITAATR